jgi:hypothetical protein
LPRHFLFGRIQGQSLMAHRRIVIGV